MLKKVFIGVIRFYQKFLSPDQGVLRFFLSGRGGYCVMYPSCSNYMIMAIEKYGIFKGILKGLRRITRCYPYQKQLVDFP